MTFRSRQFAFAAHLRDPASAPAPDGIDARRLEIYRDLFFRNVHGFLRNAFPVIRRTLGDEPFSALVRRWYAGHHARTPLFPRMPAEFVAWLQAGGAPDAPPWLAELAHYEYLETELDLADAPHSQDEVDAAGDLLVQAPVLSPFARAVAYAWPVHRIGPNFIPDEPEPTTLLVYRDRDDTVRFVETNLVTHHLLTLIAAGADRTGKAVLGEVGRALSHADPAALERAGVKTLEQLRERGVILGAR